MLDVIGAGFGRTGTNSLKLALEQLGFGPCHHMFEVRDHPETIADWQAIADGGVPSWDHLFTGFRATVDWPGAKYWRELAAFYPKAKVILSVRDPGIWYASVEKTIMGGLDPNAPLPADPVRAEIRLMVHATVAWPVFQGRIRDRDHAIRVFNAHIAEVQAAIAPDRLLTFDAKDGWEPLCRFLGAAVPDTPYPQSNTAEEFHTQQWKSKP